MSSHKKHERLQKIKEAVSNSKHLNEFEKSNAVKKIEEWIIEDKAEDLLYEELVKIAQKIENIFGELGFK